MSANTGQTADEGRRFSAYTVVYNVALSANFSNWQNYTDEMTMTVTRL